MTDAPRYKHLGGGRGEIVPPGTLAQDYAQTWELRCYLWTGSERWTADRHTHAPIAAEPYGVRNAHACWHADAMRRWLEKQATAWQRWQDRRPTT